MLSEMKLELEEIYEQDTCSQFLYEVIWDYALFKNLAFTYDKRDKRVWKAFYSGNLTAGYAFHYVENRSDYEAQFSLSYSDYLGCKFLFDYEPWKQKMFHDTISSNSYKLYLIKRRGYT